MMTPETDFLASMLSCNFTPQYQHFLNIEDLDTKMLPKRFSILSIFFCAICVFISLEDRVGVIHMREVRSLNRLGFTAIKLSRLLRVSQATRILLAFAKEIKRTTDLRGKPITYMSKSGGMEKARMDFWQMVGTDYKVRHSYGKNWEMYTGRLGGNVVEFLKSDVADSPSRIKMYSQDGGQYIVKYE